ncbi:hypothetical protein SAMN05216302_103027 [Nitrosomonas aestuarii]|uniref:Uncharacterized protein n=1 Tax=Nitrosomonas aestuarii TaxID=52441 RepID=A0A1I4EUX0_9PROT|nr:hypothetical protein [Nitrosomonas aestuarii]SFL08326.1 hypothetical protein SAMN05216302_103027 [Nitrosomonas aestuarii]
MGGKKCFGAFRLVQLALNLDILDDTLRLSTEHDANPTSERTSAYQFHSPNLYRQ